jgi:hypothetical protein
MLVNVQTTLGAQRAQLSVKHLPSMKPLSLLQILFEDGAAL